MSVVVRKAFGVAGAANHKPGSHHIRVAWPSGDWGSLPIEGGIEVAYKAELAGVRRRRRAPRRDQGAAESPAFAVPLRRVLRNRRDHRPARHARGADALGASRAPTAATGPGCVRLSAVASPNRGSRRPGIVRHARLTVSLRCADGAGYSRRDLTVEMRMALGSCLCGKITFRLDGPFQMMMHCHCSRCRKHHGSAFATFVGAPSTGFRVAVGKELHQDVDPGERLSTLFLPDVWLEGPGA